MIAGSLGRPRRRRSVCFHRCCFVVSNNRPGLGRPVCFPLNTTQITSQLPPSLPRHITYRLVLAAESYNSWPCGATPPPSQLQPLPSAPSIYRRTLSEGISLPAKEIPPAPPQSLQSHPSAVETATLWPSSAPRRAHRHLGLGPSDSYIGRGTPGGGATYRQVGTRACPGAS